MNWYEKTKQMFFEFYYGLLFSILGSFCCLLVGNAISFWGDKAGPLLALLYAMPIGSLTGTIKSDRDIDTSKYRTTQILAVLLGVLISCLISKLLIMHKTSFVVIIPLLIGLVCLLISQMLPFHIICILQQWNVLGLVFSLALSNFGTTIIFIMLDKVGGEMFFAAPLLITFLCLCGYHTGKVIKLQTTIKS